jgi:hypothetical protein
MNESQPQSEIDMQDQKIADQKIADQDIVDRRMVDQEMVDQEMVDQEMVDQEMVDQEIADQEISDQEIADQEIDKGENRMEEKIHEKIIIYKPKMPQSVSKYTTNNEGFRELIDMWNKLDLVNVIETNNPWVWLDRIGGTLLYDWSHLQCYNAKILNYKFGLFAGTKPNIIKQEMNDNDTLEEKCKVSRWIFWPKHPIEYNNFLKKRIKTYDEREIGCIFTGKSLTNKQRKYRHSKRDWGSSVDCFKVTENIKGSFPYKYDMYLQKLANSKFGLCLKGNSNKSCRQIEYMGLGVVPIMSKELSHVATKFSCKNIPGDLVEGVHFFIANTPREISKILKTVTKIKWERMSSACVKWYEENCSPEGSFRKTMQILDELKKPKIKIVQKTNVGIKKDERKKTLKAKLKIQRRKRVRAIRSKFRKPPRKVRIKIN